MIKLKNITRRETKHHRVLLDQIDLTIMPGDRIGLVGPSGGGKSTLLRAIALLDRCDEGEVWFNDKPVIRDDVPAYRRKVIYLSQRPVLSAATVRENLKAPFQFDVSQSSYDESRVTGWLNELARSDQILDQPARSLSGGEQQLICFLRAILLDPQVLLLDEPTASLDALSMSQFESLANLWQSRMEVQPAWVWASHDGEQIQRMTNRTVTIRQGRLN